MTSPLSVRQVVVGDVRTPVLVGGPGDADPTEAVLFVHGNPGRGADWRALLEPVMRFANVVAPDMPGFGGAEMRADQDFTVEAHARQLAGIVGQLGLRRVHLVAHDFGGPFALAYAADHPESVASVTLINTGVLLDYRWHRMARLWRTPIVGEVVQRLASHGVVTRLLAHDNPGLTSDQVELVARHFEPRGTKRAVLRLYRSTSTKLMNRISAQLRPYDLPCLVVWGTNDVYLPTVQADRQRDSFPSAEIHKIHGAGHWVWFERPQAVLDLVLPHLRHHVTRSRETVSAGAGANEEGRLS